MSFIMYNVKQWLAPNHLCFGTVLLQVPEHLPKRKNKESLSSEHTPPKLEVGLRRTKWGSTLTVCSCSNLGQGLPPHLVYMKLTSIYQVHFPASSCKLIGCSRWNSECCQVLPASQSIRKDSLALRASYNCSFSQAGISWTSTKDTHWIGRWVWWGSLITRRTSVSQAFSAQNLSSFFFLRGNISFQLDKGMWRLQIIAGLWVATNCLAWQIFIGRLTGGFVGRGCFSSFPWAEWHYWRCSWWTAI